MRRLQNCKGSYTVCIARPQGAQSSDFFNYYFNLVPRAFPLNGWGGKSPGDEVVTT